MNWDFKLSDRLLQVLDWVDRFEESWSHGGSQIEDFAASLPSEHRTEILREIVKVDLENHWKKGEPRRIAHYLAMFPELQGHDQALMGLYQAEFSIRDHHGDAPNLQEYQELVPGFQPPNDARSTQGDTTSDLHPTDPFKTAIPTEGTNSSVPIVAGINLGKYQILSKLGQGSFGIVYLCRDQQLDWNVAIKVSREHGRGLTSDTLHEAQTVAQLDHPNIVRLLGAETSVEGLGFVVYEYIEGKSLADRLQAKDCTREEVVEWIAQIAEALDYAHRKNVFHRDVKPGNILIDRHGKAVLVDFGLARRDGKFYASDDVVLGTKAYMPPEQIRGESDLANPETDLYSLGVVLYEALCGETPFQGGSFSELKRQIEFRAPRSLRSIDNTIPVSLESIVERALAKDPLKRVRTGRDFAAQLRRAVRPRRNYEWLLAVLAAILLTFGGVAIWPSPNPEQPTTIRQVIVRLDRDGTGTKVLSDGDLPLLASDRIDLEVHLDDYAFVYVLRWSPDGDASLLSSEDDRVNRLPLRGVNGVAGDGASLLLVGISNERMTQQKISDLKKTHLVWNVKGQILAELKTRFFTYDELPTGMNFADNPTRGGKPTDVRSPDEFEEIMGGTFDHYYGIIIPQKINTQESDEPEGMD